MHPLPPTPPHPKYFGVQGKKRKKKNKEKKCVIYFVRLYFEEDILNQNR